MSEHTHKTYKTGRIWDEDHPDGRDPTDEERAAWKRKAGALMKTVDKGCCEVGLYYSKPYAHLMKDTEQNSMINEVLRRRGSHLG